MPLGSTYPWRFSCRSAPTIFVGWGGLLPPRSFPTAGNVTHTPAYGNLIALGILDAVERRHPASDYLAAAAKYRDWLAQTGRFLTFSSGGATIGYRFRS